METTANTTPDAQIAARREVRDRIGRLAAHAALVAYAAEMGLPLTEDQFERHCADLAQKISASLQVARTHR